jgi:hypothetical protein
MIVGSATPIGTRRMWKASVNAICERAGTSWAGSDARSHDVTQVMRTPLVSDDIARTG